MMERFVQECSAKVMNLTSLGRMASKEQMRQRKFEPERKDNVNYFTYNNYNYIIKDRVTRVTRSRVLPTKCTRRYLCNRSSVDSGGVFFFPSIFNKWKLYDNQPVLLLRPRFLTLANSPHATLIKGQ